MSSNSDEIAHEFPRLFRIYKDGRLERLIGTETSPAGTHPKTGVQSKDVIINQETGVSARLYLPKTATDSAQKLPLLFYVHGGAFCIASPFNPSYHNMLNTVVSEANVVALSLDYRLAPEHHLPIAFDDTWAALQWVASHSNGNGPEPWLKDHADMSLIYLAGDSAGATLSHSTAMRVAASGLDGVNLAGMVLIHPYFGNDEADPLIEFLFPTMNKGFEPRIHAAKDPKLSTLPCPRVLVMVAEYDHLKSRGTSYYEALKKSGWSGKVDIVEAQGENHVFHLFNPGTDKAANLLKQIASFIKQD